MQLFDERYRRNEFPYGSGVWGKKEWVVPFLANENIVSTYEGGTNLLWAERYGKLLGVEDLWVKQCGNSHTGSFKDLGMTVLVSVVKQMIADGQQIAAIACASTGDTSAALANYCAAAGIPAVVLLPRNKVSPAQLVQPLANGALVLSLDTDFDGCMALVQEITKERTVYLANSMNSLRIEGQKTVAIELVQQFDWEVPDWVVIPGGNLGNVSALGKGFLLMRELGLIQKLPRIAVAQAENANPLYRSYLEDFENFQPVEAQQDPGERHPDRQPGERTSAPIRVLKQFDGVVEQASESELANEAALADRTGMFNDPAHRRRAGGAAQARRSQDHPPQAARGGDLDRARAQVRRAEDGLPPRPARGHPRRATRIGRSRSRPSCARSSMRSGASPTRSSCWSQ